MANANVHCFVTIDSFACVSAHNCVSAFESPYSFDCHPRDVSCKVSHHWTDAALDWIVPTPPSGRSLSFCDARLVGCSSFFIRNRCIVCTQRILHYCPDSDICEIAHLPVASTDASSEAGLSADVKLSGSLLKSFDLGELTVFVSDEADSYSFVDRSSAE
jgi:hypothetical protein